MTHSYLLISHDIRNSLTSHNWMEVVAADMVLVHVFVDHYKHNVNVLYVFTVSREYRSGPTEGYRGGEGRDP